MNKTIKYGLFGLGLFTLSACVDTMDTHPSSSFEEETIWDSKSTVEAFINGIYDEVIRNAGYAGSGSSVQWEARTPNAVKCSQVGEGIDGMATELGITNSDDYGANRAGLLRRCNLVIANVTESEVLTETEKPGLLAQAHFLRGLIFFDQARKMGRFVPITIPLDPAKPEEAEIPMTANVAESYDYVISDLKIAAEGLPASNSYGLPTKWAADVILSRAALQAYAYTNDAKYLDVAVAAASDVIDNSGIALSESSGLFNETDLYNPEILWAYYREKDNTSIVDFEELMRTYPNISTDNVINSKSPVALKQANGQTFEGWAVYFPTQDLVDQYLVTDEATGKALPWYETSQYLNNVTELDPNSITEAGQIDAYEQVNTDKRRMPTPQDLAQTNEGYANFTRYARLKKGAARDISDLMYTGRDKRFYTAVVHDKCTWIGETVETNLGGNLSQGVRDKEDGGWYNTVTGYYWRKGNIENPDPRAYHASKVALHFNLARLGEAYLNLAEAKLLKKDVAGAVEALNQTRTVHGGLAPSTATTEAEAWVDYIRERNCELTNEGGDLYFSYLRWGKYGGHANHGRAPGDIIADFDRPAYKIEINRDRTALLIGQVTLLNSANRNFTVKRYLLPIQQGFLDTREVYGLDHTQNEGW